jgi:hypothetical protein
MATSNNFSEQYKTISNTELLGILDNPNDYQPLAVEAAKEEFAGRRLSDAEIQAARESLIAEQAQKEKEREKARAIEARIKTAGQSFIDTINPIQPGIHSAEKTIRLIVIIFSGLILYQLIGDFKMLRSMLRDLTRFDLSSFFYFVPFVVVPVALVLLWKRKTPGWVLLVFFLTYTAVGILWVFIENIGERPSWLTGSDRPFAGPSPASYLIQMLFVSGAAYVLCKPGIREIFKIDRQKMIATIVVSALLTVIFMFRIA